MKGEKCAPAISKVDGDNGLGPLVGQTALKEAIELARQTGVGVVFARGSNHFGPISPYAFLAAQPGFASFICSHATTTIAPWGDIGRATGRASMGQDVEVSLGGVS